MIQVFKCDHCHHFTQDAEEMRMHEVKCVFNEANKKCHRMHENSKNHNAPTDANNVLAEDFFYLDLADWGYWLIKSRDGKRYSAGHDKQKVQDLIKRLNEAHRPNIHQGETHEIYVCWNDHNKLDKCKFEREI